MNCGDIYLGKGIMLSFEIKYNLTCALREKL